MHISNKTYSFLFAGSCLYALYMNSRMYPALIGLAEKDLPEKEAMWDVFAELRLRLNNPKTKDFYEKLKAMLPEFKTPLEEHAYN